MPKYSNALSPILLFERGSSKRYLSLACLTVIQANSSKGFKCLFKYFGILEHSVLYVKRQILCITRALIANQWSEIKTGVILSYMRVLVISLAALFFCTLCS